MSVSRSLIEVLRAVSMMTADKIASAINHSTKPRPSIAKQGEISTSFSFVPVSWKSGNESHAVTDVHTAQKLFLFDVAGDKRAHTTATR